MLEKAVAHFLLAGCSAAWLARLTGGQKVGGSNPLSPTFHCPFPLSGKRVFSCVYEKNQAIQKQSVPQELPNHAETTHISSLLAPPRPDLSGSRKLQHADKRLDGGCNFDPPIVFVISGPGEVNHARVIFGGSVVQGEGCIPTDSDVTGKNRS